MANKKKKSVYTITATHYAGAKEGTRLFRRKHDAARHAKVHNGFITEYELVKVGEFIVVEGTNSEVTYVPKNEESELIYGK